jgi:hypothetical protein
MRSYNLLCGYAIPVSVVEVECKCNLTADIDCPEASHGKDEAGSYGGSRNRPGEEMVL